MASLAFLKYEKSQKYNEPIGTVPNEAPVYEKPEWQGGVVPNEAPVHYMPELIIEIPEESVKPKEEPKTPQTTPKQEPKTPFCFS